MYPLEITKTRLALSTTGTAAVIRITTSYIISTLIPLLPLSYLIIMTSTSITTLSGLLSLYIMYKSCIGDILCAVYAVAYVLMCYIIPFFLVCVPCRGVQHYFFCRGTDHEG